MTAFLKLAAVPLLGLAAAATAGPEPVAAQGGPFADAAPVGGTALAAITGKADTAMTIRAQNTSTVSNNSVNGQSQTGTISFDAQAFANLNGLSLLSANTGNNVAINSSLNVNVAVQP